MARKLINVFLLLEWWVLLLTAAEVFAQSHDPINDDNSNWFRCKGCSQLLAQSRDPLYDVCFIGKRLISVGYHGAILMSDDGGNKWERIPIGSKEALASLCFPDSEHGWAVGSHGTIITTSDGGLVWKPQNSGTSKYLFGVYFVNPQKGWVVGDSGTILYTSDGGDHWQAQESGETESMLEGVRFLDEDRGFVVGEFGTILSTSDGGNNWTSVFKREEEILDIDVIQKMRATLYSLDFLDDRIGVAVGVGGCIVRTQDGGTTWEEVSSPTTNHLYRVKSINGDLYAVGLRGTLVSSLNQGQTWRLHSLPPEVSLFWYYGIAGEPKEIFLAGENGEILKLATGIRK
ncbi:conserved hypothetical protein [uncultured Desulfobacterium sp.]|uniref:Photosynthesis system II assembly factor Ycf48/Hcf136-like domain-containing protein n=1 Tax=uncultured Desulfobacterium sp. TaxID=201089 RepID=A0A445MSK4_9BACT|nr:conserved hypothetical protein [uncultured Desulfobacterium sp.]